MRIAGTTVLFLATLVAGPAQADCREDIKTILASSLTSGPYAMDLTSEAGGFSITAEMVPPDAMHSKTVMAESTSEMTVVDGQAWMNMGAGSGWTALPDTVADSMMAGFQAANDMLDSVTAEECLGTQTVDGRDLLAFRYDITMSTLVTKSTMYADPATRLPVILETQSDVGGKSTDTRAVYRYDPSIKVVAPAM
jgi:hypothetical protein